MFRKPERILPTDTVVGCPGCGRPEGTSIGILRANVIRNGVHLSVIVGDRFQCEHCLHVYGVTKNGAFKSGANMAQPPAQVPRATPPPEKDTSPDPPLFKARPRV